MALFGGKVRSISLLGRSDRLPGTYWRRTILQIELHLNELRQLVDDQIEPDPALEAAARRATVAVAEYVQHIWQLVAEGATLPGMGRGFYDPAYAESIKTIVSPYHVDVQTNYKGAMDIQHGRGPVDLKPGLLHGPHSKVGKSGQRYNVVPFRHLTPGHEHRSPLHPLPSDVYRAALAGQKILPPSEMAMRDRRDTWTYGPYAGLRREVAPGATRGTYRTYRTVSEHSPAHKWILPSLPPLDVRTAVMDYVSPQIASIIERELTR